MGSTPPREADSDDCTKVRGTWQGEGMEVRCVAGLAPKCPDTKQDRSRGEIVMSYEEGR